MEYDVVAPAIARARLRAGNDRFRGHRAHPPASAAEVARLDEEGQHPWAVVVACSDSRVPPELIFDCGLGELFVIRTAGHVLTDVELGSVVYAVRHLGVRLVVVLGHSHCGAVEAALSGTKEVGALGCLLEYVSRNTDGAACTPGDRRARAERAQISGSARLLREVPELGDVAGLEIAEAKYDTHSGRVLFLDGQGVDRERRWAHA